MLSVLVAEDDINIISYYQRFLTNEENVKIVGVSENGEDTVKLYKELKPDLLILDLGLPKLNGLEVIDELCQFESKERKCNIIVVTGDSFLKNNLYDTKKVYRIIPKSDITNKLIDALNSFIEEHLEDNFPKDKLMNLLLSLNLKPYSKSCSYLIDAISLAYEDNTLIDNIELLYNIIASRNNCHNGKIKSSIRSSIRTINRFANSNLLCSVFFIYPSDYNKVLSPKYFFNCIIYYLNNTILDESNKKNESSKHLA